MALTPVSRMALESALTEPSANTEIKDILEINDNTAGTVAASKAVIYNAASAIVGHPIAGGAYIPVLGPVTAMPASTNLLVKNTYYAENTTDAETFLLPTVANSTAGDWIVVQDTGGAANTDLITIGSAANGSFAVGCHLTGVNILATSSTEARDISISTDNSVIMAGLTNGAGGAGSYVAFVFNGTAWTASGVSRNIGNGTAATVGASAMRFAATA